MTVASNESIMKAMELVNTIFRWVWVAVTLAGVWFFAGENWLGGALHIYFWIIYSGLLILLTVTTGYLKYFERNKELKIKDASDIIGSTNSTWLARVTLILGGLIHGYVFWHVGWYNLLVVYALLQFVCLYMGFYIRYLQKLFIWERLKT